MMLELGAKMRKNHAPKNPKTEFLFHAQAVAPKRITSITVGGRMLIHVLAIVHAWSKDSGCGHRDSRR
jgi:hypothetical protein